MATRTLQSWKEIAGYLHRDVRTAQRWEKQGLPVHRPAGRRKASVFALEHELAGWLFRDQTSLQGRQPDHLDQLEDVITSLQAEIESLRTELALLAKSTSVVVNADA
jgi:phage terminase Nu1 subunit (DNA packaging protein)